MTDVAEATLLSAAEVCALAGISYRSLDYWVRCSYVDLDPEHVPDRGSGYPRRFTEAEASRFAVLARLVRAGLKVDRAAAIGRQLEASEFAPVALGEGVQVSVDRG